MNQRMGIEGNKVVWRLSYGSNMPENRSARCLQGGQASGGLDLTGFSEESKAAIKEYVDSLPADQQGKIRRIGF